VVDLSRSRIAGEDFTKGTDPRNAPGIAPRTTAGHIRRHRRSPTWSLVGASQHHGANKTADMPNCDTPLFADNRKATPTQSQPATFREAANRDVIELICERCALRIFVRRVVPAGARTAASPCEVARGCSRHVREPFNPVREVARWIGRFCPGAGARPSFSQVRQHSACSREERPPSAPGAPVRVHLGSLRIVDSGLLRPLRT
jgi:hypothetical protein